MSLFSLHLTRSRTGAAIVLLSIFVLAGCGDKKSGAGGGHGFGGPPPQVSVQTVALQTLPVSFEYAAQTQGSREVEVRARVTGILISRNYTEGSAVKAGQSLFTIDPVPFQTALARAEADQAGVEARLVNAQRQVARMKPLAEVGMVSKRDFDDALSAEQVASADLKSAATRVHEARLNLGYTRVVAPVAGVVAGAAKSDGSLISGPDVLLTTIVQVNPLWAVFGIPDADQVRLLGDIREHRLVLPQGGFKVEVTTADGTILARGGHVKFNDPLVNAATGTVRSLAEFPNPDGGLLPGQFVRVRLSGATRPDVVQVSQRAVLEGPQGKFVYVVQPSDKPEMKDVEVATQRPVEVGEWIDLPDGKAWIIRSGLKVGERVIVDGLMRIGPGAPVKAVPWTTTTAPAQTAASAASASVEK